SRLAASPEKTKEPSSSAGFPRLERYSPWPRRCRPAKAGLKAGERRQVSVGMDTTQDGGSDFLGYHFESDQRWPRKKRLDKFKDTIRAKTRRHNGQSLQAVVTDLNWTFSGWFEYFKHSHRHTLTALDNWVRMRLRSLLRFRHRRKGCGRGSDHQRWPNAFF